jgi:hypothetical protein
MGNIGKMDIIFVPIACPVCKRHSASPFEKAELTRKLESGETVQVRCGYDDETWDASTHQRVVMMKLIQEDDAVSRMARPPRPEVSWMMQI